MVKSLSTLQLINFSTFEMPHMFQALRIELMDKIVVPSASIRILTCRERKILMKIITEII